MGSMMQMDASDRARGFHSVWSEEWLEADERPAAEPMTWWMVEPCAEDIPAGWEFV
jgi:hypothetical protein